MRGLKWMLLAVAALGASCYFLVVGLLLYVESTGGFKDGSMSLEDFSVGTFVTNSWMLLPPAVPLAWIFGLARCNWRNVAPPLWMRIMSWLIGAVILIAVMDAISASIVGQFGYWKYWIPALLYAFGTCGYLVVDRRARRE